jgi:hypothetical protein
MANVEVEVSGRAEGGQSGVSTEWRTKLLEAMAQTMSAENLSRAGQRTPWRGAQ